jgi:hypothetical protein
VKAFIGKLGLWVRKLEVINLDVFPRLKNFVEENTVETGDTRIYQCVKNLQCRISKYFPKAISDSKVRFSRKPYVEVLMDIGGVFPHLSRKAFNIPILFAKSYPTCAILDLQQWQPSKQYRSMTNLENYIKAFISELKTRYDKLCWKRQPHPSHWSTYEACILFRSFNLNALKKGKAIPVTGRGDP